MQEGFLSLGKYGENKHIALRPLRVVRAGEKGGTGVEVGVWAEPGVRCLLGKMERLPRCQVVVFKLGFCRMHRSCLI